MVFFNFVSCESELVYYCCHRHYWVYDGICRAVLDLIYWRDVKKTSVVFGSTLVMLLSLALFSVLSVVAYLSLVTLTVTISYRVYRSTLSSLQKTGEGHPFQSVLLLRLILLLTCLTSHLLRERRAPEVAPWF